MLRANNQTIIGTQGSVYSDPTLRILVRTNYWLDSMVNRPQSDVNGSISVGITSVSTFASKQSLCGSVVFADTPTFVTSSAGVSGINFNHFNLFSDSKGLDGREQLEIGYSVDLPVGFFVELPFLSPAILQLLDSYATAELFGYSNYLPRSLEALGSGEVGFVGFQFGYALFCSVRASVCNALQFASPFTNTPLFMADFPSQIELTEYPIFLDNRYGCQSRRPDIHTKNILSPNWFWKVLLENGLDYPRTVLFKKHNGFEIPSVFEEGIKPLPSTVFSDWQGKSLAFDKSSHEHWVISLGLAEPVIPFGQPYADFSEFNIKHSLFLAPDLTPCSLDNLGGESCFLSDRGVGYAM